MRNSRRSESCPCTDRILGVRCIRWRTIYPRTSRLPRPSHRVGTESQCQSHDRFTWGSRKSERLRQFRSSWPSIIRDRWKQCQQGQERYSDLIGKVLGPLLLSRRHFAMSAQRARNLPQRPIATDYPTILEGRLWSRSLPLGTSRIRFQVWTCFDHFGRFPAVEHL